MLVPGNRFDLQIYTSNAFFYLIEKNKRSFLKLSPFKTDANFDSVIDWFFFYVTRASSISSTRRPIYILIKQISNRISIIRCCKSHGVASSVHFKTYISCNVPTDRLYSDFSKQEMNKI